MSIDDLPDNHQLVILTTVTDSPLAEIIRGRMESEGIPCTIGGDNQAGLGGVLPIQVLVRAVDQARATAILEAIEDHAAEDGDEALDDMADAEFGDGDDEQEDQAE